TAPQWVPVSWVY
nr:Chain C, Peripheral plasma membrane protein CASK [Mus musculus]